MAQERYLSPKEILGYLCDLEKKMPRHNFGIYLPEYHHYNASNYVPQEKMNNECQRMLEFAGMKGFSSDARYAKITADTAGNTIPGDTAGNVVHINVSEDLRNNWKAILATLAHEICHQVIYRAGIRPQGLDWMVETYTDLCTIYVGFGQLILDGYKTDVGGVKRTLGYLDWNTYQVTNHLVNIVCGGASSDNTGLKGCDIFADEAIQMWERETDKNAIVKNEFMRQSSILSEPLRKIEYLESLLSVYRNYLKSDAEKLSSSFQESRHVMDDMNNHKLAAFNMVYDAYIKTLCDPKEVNDRVLESALYNLYMDVKRQYGRVVLERELVCPCCGKRYKQKVSNTGKKIIKCTNCDAYFVVDTDEWNPTTVQRKEEQRRIEKRKQQESELEALRIKVCAEEKTTAWKEARQLESELKDLKGKLDTLPRPLRWAVKRHIKNNSDK